MQTEIKENGEVNKAAPIRPIVCSPHHPDDGGAALSVVLWDIWQDAGRFGPIKDNRFVAACIQCMDWCETESALNRVGRLLAKENMADCDKHVLQEVFRECKRAIAILTTGTGDYSGMSDWIDSEWDGS